MNNDLISRKAVLERLQLLRKLNTEEAIQIAIDAVEQQILIVGKRYRYKRATRDEKTKERVVKQKIMKLVAKHKYFAVFDTGVGKKTCLSYWEINKRLSRA